MDNIYHEDGTVTFWSVYNQRWEKAGPDIDARDLESMDYWEREATKDHLGINEYGIDRYIEDACLGYDDQGPCQCVCSLINPNGTVRLYDDYDEINISYREATELLSRVAEEEEDHYNKYLEYSFDYKQSPTGHVSTIGDIYDLYGGCVVYNDRGQGCGGAGFVAEEDCIDNDTEIEEVFEEDDPQAWELARDAHEAYEMPMPHRVFVGEEDLGSGDYVEYSHQLIYSI